MNAYWLAANTTLALHFLLLASLCVGVPAAALGLLRSRPWIALAFWTTLLVSAAWQLLPSCALTDIERWLRHRVEPDWDRVDSVSRLALRELTGIDAAEWVFKLIGVAMVLTAAYAFARYHRDQAGGLLCRLRFGERE